MEKSPRYYSLRRTCRIIRKATRGQPSPGLRLLNEMRVREYAQFFRCGLAEFGLKHDRAETSPFAAESSTEQGDEQCL